MIVQYLLKEGQFALGPMAYAKLNPLVWWWRRRRLERAIARLWANESDRNRELVRGALRGCPLCVAARKVPPNPPLDASGCLVQDMPIEVLPGTGPEGKVLFVFTSREQLRLTHATAGSIFFARLNDLYRLLTTSSVEYAGIVLKPEREVCLRVA